MMTASPAEIGRRRQGEMLQGVLRVLREKLDGVRVAEVISELESRLPPPPFEQADYPSNPGVRRFGKIVSVAIIPAVKAGWLNKTKGVWTITPEGEQGSTTSRIR